MDNSDSQSILSESEIQDETHSCPNVFTTAKVSHSSSISKCPTKPNDENLAANPAITDFIDSTNEFGNEYEVDHVSDITEPNDENCVSISSDGILNTFSLVADIPAVTDFTDSTNDNENEVDHVSDIIDNVDLSRPPEPPCIPDHDQSVEQLSLWVNNMISYLHSHGRFDTVINATWSRSPKAQYRGLTDDPISGHLAFRRALDLDGMLHAIAQGCPFRKSYLSRHTTSLKDVWSLVYTHYGHKYMSD